MKKSSFVKGAFIATFGIVITKILGIVYVIPFYALIGEQGGALYGYAYAIYTVFLNFSTVGLPLAISKMTSEYETLGYDYLKKKSFKISKIIMFSMGVISFLMLFIFAPSISHLILGDITGGNTIEDVTMVVRLISSAVLIVPLLSVTRGYLQGHKFMGVSSVATVIEQVIRVAVILVGSYLAVKVFGLSITSAVGISVFAATIGALIAYFYTVFKIRKHKKLFDGNGEVKEAERQVSVKSIVKKLVIYAVPFVIISLIRDFYNLIDMFTVVKTMVNRLDFSIIDAEATMSVFSTWGIKFNMIVIAIATGLTLSLIPNLSSDFASGNLIALENKVNKALQILVVLTLPMVIGISIISPAVWNLFYGASEVGPIVLKYSIFIAFGSCLFTVVLSVSQALNRYKTLFISFGVALFFKAGLNIPLMLLVSKFGLHPSLGVVISSLFATFVLVGINLIDINKKYLINYKETFKTLIYVVIGTLIMICSLMFLKHYVSIYTESRMISAIIIAVYSLVGGGVYFLYLYLTGVIKKIFGGRFNIFKNKK